MNEIEKKYCYYCRDGNVVIDNCIVNNNNDSLIEENDNRLCEGWINYENMESIIVENVINEDVEEKMEIIL